MRTAAGRLQQLRDLLDSGAFCDCPWASATGEDPFTLQDKEIKWIIHREACEGVGKFMELLGGSGD